MIWGSVRLLSHVWLFVTPWTAARQASLSITNSQSLPKLTSIESVMPSNHLILCHPLLLPSIFPNIRVGKNWLIWKPWFEVEMGFFCFLSFFFGHMAYVILVPQPGIKPAPSAVDACSLNHWTAREVPGKGFLNRH